MIMTAGERVMRLVYVIWVNVPVLRPLCDKLMRQVFGRLAPHWDERVAASPETRMAPVLAALELLDEPPRRILDLGCGTGLAAIALAERFPDAWVTGIDASLPMIAEATRKGARTGSAARFEVGELQATGLPDGSADLVVLLNAPPAFDEISRLLAPSGHALFVYSRGSSTPFYSRPQRLERGLRKYGMRPVAQGSAGAGEYNLAIKR